MHATIVLFLSASLSSIFVLLHAGTAFGADSLGRQNEQNIIRKQRERRLENKPDKQGAAKPLAPRSRGTSPAPPPPPPPNRLETPLGEDFTFEMRGLYWLPGLTATIRSDKGALEGTRIDLVDDLGVDGDKAFPSFEATLKFFGRHKVIFSYINISYSATTILDSEIMFQGQTYDVLSLVSSSADIQSARLAYEFDLVRTDSGFLGLQAGVNFISAELEMVTNFILSNKASVSAAVPMFGATGRFNFGPYVSGTAYAAYMTYQTADSLDAGVYLDFNPLRNLGLTLGWKTVSLKGETDTEKVDVQWSGPFAGFALRL